MEGFQWCFVLLTGRWAKKMGNWHIGFFLFGHKAIKFRRFLDVQKLEAGFAAFTRDLALIPTLSELKTATIAMGNHCLLKICIRYRLDFFSTFFFLFSSLQNRCVLGRTVCHRLLVFFFFLNLMIFELFNFSSFFLSNKKRKWRIVLSFH